MTARVGICGAGRVSSFHADAFCKADVEVVAFADPRAKASEAMAERYGARGYESLDAMITHEDLDIVAIATPHDLHVEQARTALSAGADVFMDKPLALTPQQGRELLDFAARLGRRLGVNHNLLFHPAVIRAREILGSGILGSVISANAWSVGWLNINIWDFRLDRDRTGGGAWFDAGPHLVYTLADLMGPFKRLTGFASTAASRIGGEDTAVAIGHFEGGQVATLRVSYSYVAPDSRLAWPGGWRQGIEINTTDGALKLTVSPVGCLDVFSDKSKVWKSEISGVDFAVTYDKAVEDFIRSRDQRTTPYVTAEASLEILGWVADTLR